MNKEKCPTCNTTLKSFLSSEVMMSQDRTDYFNRHLGLQLEGCCTNCMHRYLKQTVDKFVERREKIEQAIQEKVAFVPLLTCPAPIEWEYEIVDIVTTQTTSGTGFVTEMSRSFNDLFGKTSRSSNNKAKEATAFCKSALQFECVDLGGNAIISVDIDFSEIGGGSTNMLMVCMAGTAIKVKNVDVFGDERKKAIEDLHNLKAKLQQLMTDYNPDFLGTFPTLYE